MRKFLLEWRKLTVSICSKQTFPENFKPPANWDSTSCCDCPFWLKDSTVLRYQELTWKAWISSRRVVQWITGSKISSYTSQLRLLNLLPLPMFLQLNDILLHVKLSNESNQLQLRKNENLGRHTESFILHTSRTERARGELTLRTCRLVNNRDEFMDFSVITGPQGKNSGNYVEIRELWLLWKWCLQLDILLWLWQLQKYEEEVLISAVGENPFDNVENPQQQQYWLHASYLLA